MTEQSDKPAAQPGQPAISAGALAVAAEVIGLRFTDSERDLMLKGVQKNSENYRAMRAVAVENNVPPPFSFDPRLPGMIFDTERRPIKFSSVTTPALPADLEAVAFWPVTQLSQLIKS